MQELKESIGVESRTTILNPTYIREMTKGEATSAGVFAKTFQNTFAWNALKPEVIDDRLWDEIHDVYVKDKFDLDIHEFFETHNPAALQEMTAVMLETVRKGMWSATDQQIKEMTDLHTELVTKYNPSCSGFVCDNSKLREYIANHSSSKVAAEYKQQIKEVRETIATNDDKGVVMKKESLNSDESLVARVNNYAVGIIVIVAIVVLILVVRRRRKMADLE